MRPPRASLAPKFKMDTGSCFVSGLVRSENVSTQMESDMIIWGAASAHYSVKREGVRVNVTSYRGEGRAWLAPASGAVAGSSRDHFPSRVRAAPRSHNHKRAVPSPGTRRGRTTGLLSLGQGGCGAFSKEKYE